MAIFLALQNLRIAGIVKDGRCGHLTLRDEWCSDCAKALRNRYTDLARKHRDKSNEVAHMIKLMAQPFGYAGRPYTREQADQEHELEMHSR